VDNKFNTEKDDSWLPGSWVSTVTTECSSWTVKVNNERRVSFHHIIWSFRQFRCITLFSGKGPQPLLWADYSISRSPNIFTSRVKRSSEIHGLLLTTFGLSSRRYHQAYETVEVKPHPELNAQKFETQCVENQLIRTHAQTEE